MSSKPLLTNSKAFSWLSFAKYAAAVGLVSGMGVGGFYLLSDSGGELEKEAGKAVAAASGNTVEFDGTDDFLEVPNNPELAGGSAYTIEAWIKPLQNSLGGIVSKRKNNTDHCSYAMLVAPVRRSLRLYFKVNREDDDFYSRTEIPLNEWTHIAVVFDGSQSPHNRKMIYINGELDRKGKSTYTKIRQFNTNFSIGKLINNNSSHFVGEIDEVRFWDRPLEADEIQNQMCRGLAGTEGNLVGYWTFDELTGNKLRNKTNVAGLDATFQNMSDSSLIQTKACTYMN